MGALYTNQRGLVHEQSLVLAAEYGEIALKTVCAAFPGDAALFLYTPPMRHLTHDMPILSFSVSFTTQHMRFCILPRVDYCLAPSGIIQSPQKEMCLGLHTITAV